ncbi:GH36-type glycosyl hydrolase domain-containing protein [Desulfovibrio litoralis]|uniref:Cellobiose phosphorylase n=1 Tax=Desulfovibrio litoralis DSM 11393 TaxID=1121455 RepID=A0A1M7SW39_9BACT|nr:glucoamylase family protein [Desulfovibrio litoralis]SHN62671.1 Cellobiose phosphorylase [Desulfovibrio litoralis DSM 11393]
MNFTLAYFSTIPSRIMAMFSTSADQGDVALSEPPFRLELLNAEQQAQHSKTLAATHILKPGRSRSRLLARLDENERVLFDVHALLVTDIDAGQRITPAGEWLLDNFYVIEEQIRTARRHLPKGYSQELPHLLNTFSAGLPRVYAISLAAISHGDGRMDPDSLRNMVAAYQSVTILNLGELWAIPIMLRLSLVDKLRKVASRIAESRLERISANAWADQMITVADKKPKNLILSIADMARSTPSLSSSFVAELVRRLRGLGPALALPLTWVEQRLAEKGLTTEQLVRQENQNQSANQVSMSNCIGSLRILDSMNWQDFVETLSYVEQTLKEDPDGAYGDMDFATRDHYRHVLEKLAKTSPYSENDIARKAIDLAQAAAMRQNSLHVPVRECDKRTWHVGYYIIGEGLPLLEQSAEVALPFGTHFLRSCQSFPLLLYSGGLLLLTSLVAAGFVALAAREGVNGWQLYAIGLFSWMGGGHVACALVNWLTAMLITPCPLPRLDFSQGIPEKMRTLVVVPTMLVSAQNVEDLVTNLEVHFLANRDKHLHFALLTDFADALTENTPTDAPLLEAAQTKIEILNRKYNGEYGDSFFLFQRPRLWNPQESLWMGYERKRGKLADLNRFLLSGKRDNFSHITGDTAVLSGVKYVITLDTDTQLARDSARKFIGAMAHPLNLPCYDQSLKRVVAGYGILQPRVTASLPGSTRSRYAQLCSNETGIDPYTRASSDTYQDLFAEGSFIGKGIYDVTIFEQALGGRLPANRILSHDLLEGCYARSGLLSDVQLYEAYPARYSMDVSRRYRWIRGDWQIASWILPMVPAPAGQLCQNPLSALSRWKILDNLRRSLTAPALICLLIIGWSVSSSPLLWSMAVVALIFLPFVFSSSLSLFHKSADMSLRQHISTTVHLVGRHCIQALISLICLPHEAIYSMEAISRTAWRVLVSHKHLLEWNHSAVANRHDDTSLRGAFRFMWIGPVIAIVGALLLFFVNPGGVLSVLAVLPLLVLWLVSPAVMWWVSLPLLPQQEGLTAEQLVFLRKLARKTWRFFETFVGSADNWLPPDNYQEQPVARIAHRTSPTNMGLALLANLCAYDFGTLTVGELVERTEKALQTMNRLERFRGHFYNWYDTQSLLPLTPLYVSSVDSGNLAGHLLTLHSGLAEIPDRSIFEGQIFTNLCDTLDIAHDCLTSEMHEPTLQIDTKLSAFVMLRHQMSTIVQDPPSTLSATQLALSQLGTLVAEVLSLQVELGESSNDEFFWWVLAFERQCRNAQDELGLLCPWVHLPIAQRFVDIFPELDRLLTLRELVELEVKLAPRFAEWHTTLGENANAAIALQGLINTGSMQANDRLVRLANVCQQCVSFSQMDYDFLYSVERRLLSIGYNVNELRQDAGFYDLLASEARLTNFVAIAQGMLPQESWFALGRLLTNSSGEPILLSWSGSMFEYLMPLLVMPGFQNTLLNETCKVAVSQQIAYGKLQGVPWGISECGYNAFDASLNYQYRAFGVPGLGLKRGLAAELVVAPYASALALLVAPSEACMNLQRLAAENFEGQFGMYEAIDYTPSRVPRGQTFSVVRSFMAHHQGMSLLAFGHLLLGAPMLKRFTAEPLFQATMLLLQERVPEVSNSYAHTSTHPERIRVSGPQATPLRIFETPDTPHPEVQLLSNGSYHVMLTQAGGGYSRWRDMAVTRWCEDSTRDNWGTFCYIKDLESGEFWSTAYQPLCKTSTKFQAIFSEGRVEFNRMDCDYDTHMEVVVSSEDDIELRRIRITNRSSHSRSIEVTSFAEVVLSLPLADELHPAFSKLFVQTQIVPEQQAILCARRPRSANEKTPWMLHTMAVHGVEADAMSYETDRQEFIGRGRSTANPQAMDPTYQGAPSQTGIGSALSGREGSVLDPIVAIRARVTLNAEQSVTIDIITGIGETREKAVNLINTYRDRNIADRAFDMTWTHGQVLLRQLGASEADANLYNRLASSIIYANSSLRAPESVLIKNRRGQSGLWGYAISGDLPIVLVKIEDLENIDLVRQLLQAHEYWRLKGLAVDLVIWNEDQAGYRQLLHDQIMGLITAGNGENLIDRPGGIFVRAADRIVDEDRILFQTVARVILSDAMGTLSEQIQGFRLKTPVIPALAISERYVAEQPATLPATLSAVRPDLLFYNGLGGFTPDGREYVITTSVGSKNAPGQLPPAPWVNVLANPHFGTVVSESGPAYTWSENAHEFRLTPWGNDSVTDGRGEAFYLRDENSGHYWSPTPAPCPGTSPYVTRHGFGYSVFEHTEDGIYSELRIYVALDGAVKFSSLKIRNASGRSRNLSATGYVEWVLGDLRARSCMHVVTEIDPDSRSILAHNPYNTEFPHRTAFFGVDSPITSVSGDRTEFIGRNGSLSTPIAMSRTKLSGRVGAAMDPCAAIQVVFTLGKGEEKEIIFKLGVGKNLDDARALLHRYAGAEAARTAQDKVWQHWAYTLGAIHVETPDESFNLMANGWLVYQTLACRFWGRSATYQSGGAIGFRDQLQDAMALIHARPDIVREHLLLCAAHQFPKGDVQHWWHPPLDRGVRTHCSDDYLWLPLAVCRYILTTGDTGVLDEPVYFIDGRPLKADEESYYDLPGRSEQSASLYEHCTRAINNGLSFGVHGLPLMGSGDWNDGMDLVGRNGQGESVWLAFFLHTVLTAFSSVAAKRGDMDFAALCLEEAATLRRNISLHAWDGEWGGYWYRRAYFDDGSPLGSILNPECRIDSIAQSWSVLSGAGDRERSLKAMDSLDKHLVDRKHKLVQLFEPPFDSSAMNPGYIKGYAPGVRENGGQYTHAAVWAAMAFAQLGDAERAWEVLNIINPINHGRTPEEVAVYKVEPYVMAADVYAAPLHVGRGGWTWYTGAAAWTYRLMTESLLGLTREGDQLHCNPCLPTNWNGFTTHYRYQATMYHITVVQRPEKIGTVHVTVDGVLQEIPTITMVNDKQEHTVEVVLS